MTWNLFQIGHRSVPKLCLAVIWQNNPENLVFMRFALIDPFSPLRYVPVETNLNLRYVSRGTYLKNRWAPFIHPLFHACQLFFEQMKEQIKETSLQWRQPQKRRKNKSMLLHQGRMTWQSPKLGKWQKMRSHLLLSWSKEEWAPGPKKRFLLFQPRTCSCICMMRIWLIHCLLFQPLIQPPSQGKPEGRPGKAEKKSSKVFILGNKLSWIHVIIC